MSLRLDHKSNSKYSSPGPIHLRSPSSVSMSNTSNRLYGRTSYSSFVGDERVAKQLRSAFKKFEDRQMTKKDFVDFIQNDMGIEPTAEFEQRIDRPEVKFKDVLKSLPVHPPRDSEYFVASSVNPTSTDYRRYRRNLQA